jgi:hypothetical protein
LADLLLMAITNMHLADLTYIQAPESLGDLYPDSEGWAQGRFECRTFRKILELPYRRIPEWHLGGDGMPGSVGTFPDSRISVLAGLIAAILEP